MVVVPHTGKAAGQSDRRLRMDRRVRSSPGYRSESCRPTSPRGVPSGYEVADHEGRIEFDGSPREQRFVTQDARVDLLHIDADGGPGRTLEGYTFNGALPVVR